MAVTIRDVAKAARVSLATVSRALNGSPVVTPRTRKRIESVAARLGYVPHEGARSLSSRRTGCIGAVLPDLHGEFFSELIRGIDRAARGHRLHLLLASSHGDAEEAAAALRAMRGRVDGLLVMSPYVDRHVLEANLLPSMPTVLLNTDAGGERYPSLVVDNYGGAVAMMRHLAGRGHRRIAMISGPEDNFDARARLAGYVDALHELRPGTSAQVLRGDFTEASGHGAGKRLAAMSRRPDAVFAANDMMAVGCLYAFREAGLEVPGDIAVAGFDDVPIARYVSPALTTVRICIDEMGEKALERLLPAIQGDEAGAPAPELLRTELVIRESCARTRSALRALPQRRKR
jgi:LacI family transcriptional regulator